MFSQVFLTTLILFLVVGVGLLASMLFTIQPKQAATITRFGKYHRTAHAGLNWKLPYPIDIVDKKLSLAIQHRSETIRIKTKDMAYVDMPITIFVEALEGQVREAAYNLKNPHDQIIKLAGKEIRTLANGMDLDQLFGDKKEMEEGVKSAIDDFVSSHGYHVTNVVIDQPTPSDEIQLASNEVIASLRMQEAAKNRAESIRLERVGEAVADAQALTERSRAFADSRDIVAKGMSTAALTLRDKFPDLTHEQIIRIMEGVDWRDALISCSKGKGTIIIDSSRQGHGLAELVGLVRGVPGGSQPASGNVVPHPSAHSELPKVA